MPPNILYLHSHDTGRFVQPHGHAPRTPNLQRLSDEGVLFRRAFSAAPTCSPSRAALLTGQWPHVSGMLGLAHRGFRLADPSRHLASVLRGHGYSAVLCGTQHEAQEPRDLGYDRILPTTRDNRHEAAAEHLRARPSEPFFLSVGFVDTHRLGREDRYAHCAGGPQGDPRRAPVLPNLPDTARVRLDLADLVAAAERLDARMGAVLDALRDAGLDRTTIVVCTSDHGIAFPGHKCNLTDRGLGVMLMIRGPGFEPGRVVDAMVSHVDVAPTLLEACGLPAPPWLAGTSMRPLLDGSAASIREELFGEVTYHAAYEPMRAVRTARWSYVRRFHDFPTPILPNCDEGPARDELLDAGWAERPLPREELYDLTFDPAEMNSRAADPSCADALRDMRARLQRWMERTDDPLLRGAVPAPIGAGVNRMGQRSPSEPPVRVEREGQVVA